MCYEYLENFDSFITDTIYDAFCKIDRWAYQNSPGIKGAEAAALQWMENDRETYYQMEKIALSWRAVYTDLCYETRLFYYQYAHFLVKNNRPVQDLQLLTDDVLYSYSPIKQLMEKLEILCQKIEAIVDSHSLSFRKYQETQIAIDKIYADSTVLHVYYLMQKYNVSQKEMEKIFSKMIQHPSSVENE